MLPATPGLISGFFKLIVKIITGIFKLFSLAIVYALVGVVLYAVWDFNPFSGDIYAVLYLVGFGLCVLLSLLIAFRDKGKKSKRKSSEPAWRWGKRVDAEEEKPSWWERRKEKKRLREEQEREEALRQEKLEREENIRAQERKLEELRAERLKEEIAREERLIEGYRHEAAVSALNRYEEVVSAHPIPSYEESDCREQHPSPRYDEVNYFGGGSADMPLRTSVTRNYEAPISPLKREIKKSPKIDEINYFSALNNAYEEPISASYSHKPSAPAYDYQPSAPVRKEEPKIYMSAVEENVLIHEYSDRFEVYRLEGGEKTLQTIEYKDR